MGQARAHIDCPPAPLGTKLINLFDRRDLRGASLRGPFLLDAVAALAAPISNAEHGQPHIQHTSKRFGQRQTS